MLDVFWRQVVVHASADVVGILTEPAGRFVRYLDVEVDGSTVTLNGVVPSVPMAKRCCDEVAEIPGVNEVICNLQEMPQYSYPLI